MATLMINAAEVTNEGAPEILGSAGHRPFAEVAREHLDRLYGYCVHLCGNRTDAEDLLQDSLIRAMRGYDALRDQDAVKSWLFTVATSCARDRWRARGRQLDTVPLDASGPDDEFSLFTTIAIEDPFPYSDALHLDFLRLFEDEDIQAVFTTMTPAFRGPILLTTIHGFSCKETAVILEIPLGTLLSRLHRGRKQLERGLVHFAGPTAGGWQVVNVWESQEAADRWMNAKVNPARQKAGLAEPVVTVFPVHRLAK